MFQTLCDTAECAGRSGCHLRGTHSLSPHHTGQILVGQLRKEICQIRLFIIDIPETYALVTGADRRCRSVFEDSFRQIHTSQRHSLLHHAEGFPLSHRPHAVKRRHRGQSFLQLLRHDGFLLLKGPCKGCTAHICPHIEAIASFLQHIAGFMSGSTAVIVRGQFFFRDTQGKGLFLSRPEHPCFPEGCQAAKRFSQPSLRRIGIHLHHLFAGRRPRICHTYLQMNGIPFIKKRFGFYGKLRIRQAETEWIKDLVLCRRFKIAVTHINIFRIDISVFITEPCR